MEQQFLTNLNVRPIQVKEAGKDRVNSTDLDDNVLL